MNKFGKALIISLSLAGSAVIAPVVASAGVGVDITVAPPEVGRTSGFPAAGWESATATIGSRIVGSSVGTIGITGTATGSARIS